MKKGKWREFHVARNARDRYRFDQMLYATNGNVIFANFRAAMAFAQKINEKRDLERFPEQAVKPGQINALGLIDEILHLVALEYRLQKNATVAADALAWLDAKLGREQTDAVLRRFTDDFPPVAVYRRDITAEAYLAGETDGAPNRQIALEELLMLWLANANPACTPYAELFDDAALEKETAYRDLISELHAFFDTQPGFGPDDQNLIDMLRSPSEAAPHSLFDQLEYIRTRWGFLLDRYLYRLLSSLDFIKEEEKPIFFWTGRPSPPVPVYETEVEEAERFSPDQDWMPKVVILAKNTYVWLDQLSRTYQRPVTRLDQIPDEELDVLAQRGFTGLWLIGLWERSAASRRIKQMGGNPEAVASAYSLFGYEIARDLGGPEALDNLKQRAWQRGIRLASDMVPNHVGIDAQWVIDHPDWFISVDTPPFSAYTFNGANLSGDDRVGIFLEDHYYDRSDAAVVFKRVDFHTGRARFIYHGNDGTNMPWNDTAQLNFLRADVREAVIQTILHVARRFSVIRFDAAMTLTKRHYQRLWFPEPGSGGAIPSRAEHGLTRERFDEAMPQEFWREVVDRVAREAPDTLLLAEAFWLMEGYFVRTLGMHRVYNSAFMNMLRDEDNAKYRLVMKNTLEFDPEVLKRFVNFMNNPDEDTAVDQFGKGDKYFGICTMMVTLPGLPMFGHGQIEGFAEKYGMEYQRAYRDEIPDQALIERHEREIFPLLHRRHLFAEVRAFLLYDFRTPEGVVNEDVFAYSNRHGDERALMVYHNKYAEARGWIRSSVGFAVKNADGSRAIVNRSLSEGLALRRDEGFFTIFRDHVTGLEYIRNNRALCEQGLYIELGAYQYHVFLDFREVQDDAWRHYAHLTDYLNGRGVPDIDAALREILLQPVHRRFAELVNADGFRRLMTSRVTKPGEDMDPVVFDEAEASARALLDAIAAFTGGQGDTAATAQEIRRRLEAALRLPASADEQIAPVIASRLDGDPAVWGTLLGWVCVHDLGKVTQGDGYEEESRSWLDEWHLGRLLAGVLRDFGLDEPGADYAVTMIKLLTAHQRWYEACDGDRLYDTVSSLLRDQDAQRILQVNRYQEALWFAKEAFEETLWWMGVTATIIHQAESTGRHEKAIRGCWKAVRTLQQASDASGYRVEKLVERVKALQE